MNEVESHRVEWRGVENATYYDRIRRALTGCDGIDGWIHATK